MKDLSPEEKAKQLLLLQKYNEELAKATDKVA